MFKRNGLDTGREGFDMNTWIFQGNPKKFDVDAYLQNRSDIRWTVGNNKIQNSILLNDIAFLWRSDGDNPRSGGIIAKGIITIPPRPMEDDAQQLWKSSQKNTVINRVAIRIEEFRLSFKDGMLLRTELESHPVLRDLWILKWRAAILYSVTPEHAGILDKLWESRRSARGNALDISLQISKGDDR